jgi:hypothetical protein
MKSRNLILIGLTLVVAGALFWSVRNKEEAAGHPAHSVSPPAAPAPAPAPVNPAAQLEERVPPHYATLAAAQPLPKTLAPERFHIPVVARAYTVARKIPEVLAQQPCYCWCDKFGHASLLDCFATEHGAG